MAAKHLLGRDRARDSAGGEWHTVMSKHYCVPPDVGMVGACCSDYFLALLCVLQVPFRRRTTHSAVMSPACFAAAGATLAVQLSCPASTHVHLQQQGASSLRQTRRRALNDSRRLPSKLAVSALMSAGNGSCRSCCQQRLTRSWTSAWRVRVSVCCQGARLSESVTPSSAVG